MRKSLPATILVLAMALLASSLRPLAAQQPAPPAPTPGVDISAADREKFKAAYDKALQDPQVVALQKSGEDLLKEYRNLVKAKALEIDPSLQPVFIKMDAATAAKIDGGILAVLSPEEKQKVHDIFVKVSDDPQIKELQAKGDAIRQQKNAAIRAAILKIDPTLGPLLDQIDHSMAARQQQQQQPPRQ